MSANRRISLTRSSGATDRHAGNAAAAFSIATSASALVANGWCRINASVAGFSRASVPGCAIEPMMGQATSASVGADLPLEDLLFDPPVRLRHSVQQRGARLPTEA